jgi:hypothetical protein
VISHLIPPTLLACVCLVSLASDVAQGADGPGSKFVVGSIWEGTETTIPQNRSRTQPTTRPVRLEVIEIDRNTFKAKLVRASIAWPVVGRIEDGKLSWAPPAAPSQAKNVVQTIGTIQGSLIRADLKPAAYLPRSEYTLRLDEASSNGSGFVDFPDLDAIAHMIDVGDPAAVRHWLAWLMSSPYYYAGNNARMPIPERLALPFRRNRTATPKVSGYSDAEEVLIGLFDQLTATPDANLQAMATEARDIVGHRIKIAQVNQRFGVTPDGSLITFGQWVLNMTVQAKKLDELLDQDQRDPEIRLKTLKQAREALKSLNSATFEDVAKKISGGQAPSQAELSLILAFSDMLCADRQGELWRDQLLPALVRSSSTAKLSTEMEVKAVWRNNASQPPFQLFERLLVKNPKGGQELTNVVMKVVAKDEKDDSATQYYFISKWAPDQAYTFVLHPRWMARKMTYTPTIRFDYSLWSDQGQNIDKTTTVTSPMPNPNPDAWRFNWEKQDLEFAPLGARWAYLLYAAPLPNGRPPLPAK